LFADQNEEEEVEEAKMSTFAAATA